MQRPPSAGFTIVEIAIVLTVVGLLLFAVLKGDTVIHSARNADIVATAKDLGEATQRFKERYKYLPGDLPGAAADIPNIPAACNIPTTTPQIGNGLIDTADESSCVIDMLVAAGLIKAQSDPADATRFLIRTTHGRVTVMSASISSVPNFRDGTIVALFQDLPCVTAVGVDTNVDDGNITAASGGRAKSSLAANCTPGGVGDPVPVYAMAIN
jgi:type II secretory pathway pseudopilin PulG